MAQFGLNPDLLTRLVEAVTAIHTPSSTDDARRLAQKFCDDFKDGEPQAPLYGLCLAQATNSDVVRHFGLHILEHVIRSKWDGFTEEQRDALKSTLLELMAAGTRDLVQEQLFVKEKLTALVVEIAKREWPHRWEDMFSRLKSLVELGNTQAELSLMVLRTLPDEALVYNAGLLEARRKALMVGLNTSLPTLFPYFYMFMASKYTIFKEAMAAQRPDAVEIGSRIVKQVLTTLLSYLEWVPVALIFDNDFVNVFCVLLHEPPFRMLACDALLLVVSRRLEEEHTPHITRVIDELSTLCSTFSYDYQENEYAFRKRVCQVVGMLGERQGHLFNRVITSPGELSLHKLLALALSFFGHPSLLLSSFVTPFLHVSLKNTNIVHAPWFQDFLPQLMKVLHIKILKQGDPNREDSIVCQFSRMDFDDHDDYMRFFAIFRNRILDIQRGVAQAKPDLALQSLLARIQEILCNLLNLGKDSPLASVHAPAYIDLEGQMALLEVVLTTAKDQSFEGGVQGASPLGPLVENLLTVLFNYECQDPLILTRIMHGISTCIPYFKAHPHTLNLVIDKFFSYLLFHLPSEVSLDQMSLDTQSARRKAITSLLHICNGLEALMLPYLEVLWKKTEALFEQQVLLESEKVLLLEMLVVVSNNMQNFETQSQFIGTLLRRSEMEWTSSDFSSIVQDPRVFLQRSGLTNDPLSPAAVAFRKRILYNMQTIFTISRRTKVPTNALARESGGFGPHIINGISLPFRHPFTEHLHVILPHVLALCRCIHSLSQPAVRMGLAPPIQGILDLSLQEKLILLGRNRQEAEPTDEMDKLRFWLGSLRDMTYYLLGQASCHGDEFFLFPGLVDMLVNSVFSSLEYIENRFMCLLLRAFVHSFVSKCPTHMLSTLLDPILPVLFAQLFGRLSAGWTSLGDRGQGDPYLDASDLSNVTQEVIDEKVLRDLTRDLMELILAITAPKETVTGPSPLIDGEPTDLSRHLFFNEAIAGSMLRNVIGALYWPDSLSTNRALTISYRMVTALGNNPMYHQLLGNDMLTGALQALMQRHNLDPEQQLEMVGVVKEVYCRLLPISPHIPRTVFMALPGMKEGTLRDLETSIAKKDSGDKKCRQIFRKFLRNVISKSTTPIQQKRPMNILNLPEKLVIASHFTEGSSRPIIDKDLGLPQLFERTDE